MAFRIAGIDPAQFQPLFAMDDAALAARLCLRGTTEEMIAELFAIPEIAYLHAHNAAHGCFAARVDRA